MQNQLTILGCGSALPTKKHFPSAQILTLREKHYLIDCGEGTQIRMRQMGITNTRFGQVFISHLHGDHCFGLMGMISSFGMLNRTADLHIHAHADLENLLAPQLRYFCADLPFKIYFHPINPAKNELIFEDRSVSVYSIPLKHRVPTCGFLFEEKPRERHIIREMIDFHEIPVSQIHLIKKGADFVKPTGEIIANERLTTAPTPPKRFAYCSDTVFSEQIIPIIEGVDCLYHEATFAESESARAIKTMHSTARQSAEIAKRANVKKLILGHYSARYSDLNVILEEAKSVFPNTVLGEDMRSYKF